jgi:hypothetical protein
MTKTETANINKKNKELVTLINSILNSNEAEYIYHYEKGHYVNGYDGEPGFMLDDRRSGAIYFNNCHVSLKGINSNYQNDFRIFTLEEVYNQIKEDSEIYDNNKSLLYVKMMFDEHFKPTEKKQQKSRVKV